jgi:galactosamine-6-phosphate isomerase
MTNNPMPTKLKPALPPATTQRSSGRSAENQPPGKVPQIAADAEAMSRAAADYLAAEIGKLPRALLCLATGVSPARTYELLAEKQQSQPHLFDQVRLMKLDEWYGLQPTDPASCEWYLRQKLVTPLQVSPERFFGWNSRARNPQAECQRVADWLATQGRIDVCVLGLGLNGHLGFNEPANELSDRPHFARLSETSMNHSMLGAAKGSVRFGFTLGMANILQARKVILLVSGPHKAGPLRRLLTGMITPQFPASLLWLHPALTIICDRAAASGASTNSKSHAASPKAKP